MITAGLRGEHLPPTVTRSGARRRWAEPAPAAAFGDGRPGLAARACEVVAVREETHDTIAIELALTSGPPLDYRAGQFLTIEREVAGATLRRAYSLCLPPGDGPLTIAVKRIPGGRVSNDLHDRLRVGDQLAVRGPTGTFVLDPPAGSGGDREILAIAGGSGITPVFSVLGSMLGAEPTSRAVLVYGSRSPADIIFRERLDALAERSAGRLIIDHLVASDATAPGAGDVIPGILDRATIDARLSARGVAIDRISAAYVCGPEPVRIAARAALRELGLANERILEEAFLRHEAEGIAAATEPRSLTVTAAGRSTVLTVAPRQTILEAVLAAGNPLPFSCTVGGCGTCRVRVHEGRVAMQEPNCLSEAERRDGYALTCVGYLLTDAVIEVLP